jgi:hypothetical protein
MPGVNDAHLHAAWLGARWPHLFFPTPRRTSSRPAGWCAPTPTVGTPCATRGACSPSSASRATPSPGSGRARTRARRDASAPR